MQQLLRKLHIGGGNRREEDDAGSPRWPPDRQNSWDSEHDNELLQERERASHSSIASRLQIDSYRGSDANASDGLSLPLVAVGHSSGPYNMGREVEHEEFGGFQVFKHIFRYLAGLISRSLAILLPLQVELIPAGMDELLCMFTHMNSMNSVQMRSV